MKPLNRLRITQLKILQKELAHHWLMVFLVFLSLVSYAVICHHFQHDRIPPLLEEQRMVIRSVFYVLAIIALPITNLIRHIQLRLNQTVPGKNSAKNRYGYTVLVSMVMMEGIGLLGFVMFMLGDGFNTLYIFLGLSTLGLFLYRPKPGEYASVVEALSHQK